MKLFRTITQFTVFSPLDPNLSINFFRFVNVQCSMFPYIQTLSHSSKSTCAGHFLNQLDHPRIIALGLASSVTMYPVGRSAWSLQYASKMAVGLGSAQATDEEARAEVEVLNSRLEKTSQLTKKIQASLARLESTGKSVQDAVGPIYGNTQKLQIIGSSTCLQMESGMYSDVIQILMELLELSNGSGSPQTSRAVKRILFARG